MRSRVLITVAPALLAVVLATGACSSDDTSDKAAPTTPTASDEMNSRFLHTISNVTTEAAPTTDKAAVTASSSDVPACRPTELRITIDGGSGKSAKDRATAGYAVVTNHSAEACTVTGSDKLSEAVTIEPGKSARAPFRFEDTSNAEADDGLDIESFRPVDS